MAKKKKSSSTPHNAALITGKVVKWARELELVGQLLVGLSVYAIGLIWAIWTRKAWQVEGIHDEETARETAMALVETYQQEEA